MSTSIALTPAPPRRIGRSVAALLAAIVANVVLAFVIDELLHVLAVYPPWGVPMYATSLNALALSYRLVIAVLGGVIVARLAPRAPVRHALFLAAIGLVLGALGVVVAFTHDLGPVWYPIALALLSPPAGIAGAVWYARRG